MRHANTELTGLEELVALHVNGRLRPILLDAVRLRPLAQVLGQLALAGRRRPLHILDLAVRDEGLEDALVPVLGQVIQVALGAISTLDLLELFGRFLTLLHVSVLALDPEMVNHVKNDEIKIEIRINCFKNKRFK